MTRRPALLIASNKLEHARRLVRYAYRCIYSSIKHDIAARSRDVQVACDSEINWHVLLELLGTPQPTNLATRYFDLHHVVETAI